MCIIKIVSISNILKVVKHLSDGLLWCDILYSAPQLRNLLAVKCFEKAKLEGNLKFAKHHRGIVEKFGRFPHRNEALERTSTEAEIEYLNSAAAFKG